MSKDRENPIFKIANIFKRKSKNKSKEIDADIPVSQDEKQASINWTEQQRLLLNNKYKELEPVLGKLSQEEFKTFKVSAEQKSGEVFKAIQNIGKATTMFELKTAKEFLQTKINAAVDFFDKTKASVQNKENPHRFVR